MAGESLSATYSRNLRQAEDADNLRWLQDRIANPPAKPAQPAKPEEAKKPEGAGALESASAGLKAGVKTAAETFWQGASNFATGAVNYFGQGERQARDVASGQTLYGALQVLSALPAGAGAAVQEALKNYKPGMEKEVALPGGPNSAVHYVRTILSLPAKYLDPETQKQIKENPQAWMNEMDKPMTYGELSNLVTQFAAPVAAGKLGKAGKAGKAPEVVGKAPEVIGQKALPSQVFQAGTGEINPRDAAARLDILNEQLRGGAQAPDVTGEVVPPQSPMASEVKALPPRTYEMGEGVKPGPFEPGGTPLKPEELAAQLDILRNALREAQGSTPPEGSIRLYRGEQLPSGKQLPEWIRQGLADSGATDASGRWYTDDPKIAEWYLREAEQGGKGQLKYVDVPRDVYEASSMKNQPEAARFSADQAKEFFVPREYADRAQPLPGGLWSQLMKTLGEEAGSQRFGGGTPQEGEFQPNYERLDITPQLKGFMQTVHKAIQRDIAESRGPAKTHEYTERAALERINTGKMSLDRLLALEPDEMLSREDYTAARILSTRANQEAMKLRDRLNAGEALPEGSYKQAIAVAAASARNTLVARTRIAQAQESGRIQIGGEKLGLSLEDAAHLAQDIAPGMSDKDLATMHSTLETPAQQSRMLQFMSIFPRMALQAMYFSYLSGKAVGHNLFGNIVPMVLTPSETGIARYMPIWTQAKAGELARVLPDEGSMLARVAGESLVDHVRMLKHMDRIEEAFQQSAQRAGVQYSLSKADIRSGTAYREFGELMQGEGSNMAQLGDWADRVTDFPTRVLDNTDLASKATWGRMQMRIEAYHQAVKEGLAGEKMLNRIAELENDVTQLNGDARARIQDVAETNTYTKEFMGRVLKALAQGPSNQWLNFAYRGTLLPFFRSMAEDMAQSMSRLPGMFWLSKQFYQDMAAGGRKQQIAQAKIVHTAAVMGAFMYMESQGLVNGNGPSDPDMKKKWIQLGFQPRTFWDPVSEKYRSYDGLGQATTLISSAADTSLFLRKLPAESSDAMHIMVGAWLSQVNNLDSRQFTQSVSNLIEAFRGGTDSQVNKVIDFVRKQVGGWARPGVAREVESVLDPEVRKPIKSGAYDDGLQQEFQLLKDEVSVAWPWFSTLKDKEGNFLVPPDRDPLTGEPTIIESWPFHPFPGKSPKPLPFTRPDNMPKGYEADVRAELRRLNGGGLDTVNDWIGGARPGPDYGFGPESVKEGIRLTSQAKDVLVKAMTQDVKDAYGHTYSQALQALMSDTTYWEQSDGVRGNDGGKAEMLKATEDAFRQLATAELYRIAPKIQEKVLLKQSERAVQKVPTSRQSETRENVQRQIRDLTGTLTR